MKKFQKILAVVLCLALILSVTACGGGGSTPSTGANTAPTISGVADQSVEAGKEFDALAGVTASDKEDGDVTGKIVITSMPELSFSNGKVTVNDPGNYELTYTVTDKGGMEAKAYATLTVTRQTGEAVVYEKFDFANGAEGDAHGWEARIGESAQATGGHKQGAFVFEIANPGDGDGAIQMAKPGFALEAGDYRVKVWAKSSAPTYAHLIARNEKAEGWETFGAVWNARIEENIAPIELFFTSEGEGSAELLLNLGKITPNGENPADTTPNDFVVTVDKVELYKITGEEHEVEAFKSDLTAADAVTVEAGDGAAAAFNGGAVAIDAYPTDGGVWSIKANLGLGGQTIANGTKYYYRFTVNAEKGVSGEALVESLSQYHEARVNFNGLNAAPGEDVVVTSVFTADRDISDPVIRLQIGNAPEGATANKIVIKDLSFGTVEGDKEVTKTTDSFSVPFAGNDYSWGTFNATDEDNERGVGTIWTENGHLFYRIDQGGVTDWHNKLYMNLDLPADSYFVVEITGKATKPVSCGFFLNPAGSWDPRVSEGIDFTTEEKTFSFETTETLILDMPFEMLFQFGSAALAEMGDVTIEISDITIWQKSVN
ncbi:MAG: DUF5011 domain-containing protein [Lachnospiraceae bacterium]|nr:DUF5011 domain-containing protein [Lachnospiraceae bacterium]